MKNESQPPAVDNNKILEVLMQIQEDVSGLK